MNGIDLRGKRIEEVCDMLVGLPIIFSNFCLKRNTSGEIRFLISSAKEPEQKKNILSHVIHLRALFDYDPEVDGYQYYHKKLF